MSSMKYGLSLVLIFSATTAQSAAWRRAFCCCHDSTAMDAKDNSGYTIMAAERNSMEISELSYFSLRPSLADKQITYCLDPLATAITTRPDGSTVIGNPEAMYNFLRDAIVNCIQKFGKCTETKSMKKNIVGTTTAYNNFCTWLHEASQKYPALDPIIKKDIPTAIATLPFKAQTYFQKTIPYLIISGKSIDGTD